MNAVEAYPLHWPAGWERSSRPARSKFKTSFHKSTQSIVKQLSLMRATGIVISTNIPLRQDGLPFAKFSRPFDQGVAVYFTYKKRQMVFACDSWTNVEDNMHAISLTIEAIRGIERWGASEMLERAFTGFTALEAPVKEEWWHVLGCHPATRKEIIKEKYHQLAKEYHPDAGGSNEKMAKLNEAFAQALRAGTP